MGVSRGEDTVPQSPAFATSSSFAPALSRPDHSTLDLSSATTTPKIPPPPLYHDPESYGHGDDEGDLLLSGATTTSSTTTTSAAPSLRYARKTNPVHLLFKLVAGTVAFVCCLVVLSRLSFLPAPSPSHRARVAHHLTPYMPQSVLAFIRPATGPSSPHPILPLVANAREAWRTKQKSQSTTFDRATKTYRQRYGFAPPPGFDKWFAFATQGKNHSLVDEYDQLMADLLPYRALAPHEIRRRTAELAQVPGISIVSIRNGVAQVHSKSGKWAPALAFQQMIGAFVRDLPDMDVAVNERPEGRVLPKIQKRVSMADYGLEGANEPLVNMSDPMITPHIKNFSPEWKHDGSIWESYRRSCPPESAARRLVETVRSAETNGALVVQGRSNSKSETTRRKQTTQAWPTTREMTFSADLDASFDICDTPSLHTLHSAFFSDQRSIDSLYPVFSPSKPPGYADILIPSHHYWSPSSEFTYEWELQRGRTKTPSDPDWAQKRATAYWRGKVTRGADTPGGHGASFQKQRLVKMANHAAADVARVVVGFDKASAGLDSVAAPVGLVNAATSDIAMACDPQLGECSYLRSLGYRVEPPAPLSDAWRHKFVLDIDEIGFSPRFLALMESKSAVVKSSIQREFWRGWAQPWKHFIPLSSSYSELYNLQTFFTGIPASLLQSGGGGGAAGTNETKVATTTTLSRPVPVPALPDNEDGTEFDADKVLKEIADAGSRWKKEHLRKEDMECYVYRLMVEWANLVAPLSEERGPAVEASSIVVFDDTDTQTISYSETWTGYQGQGESIGTIDARDWVGQSFHACRAEPLNASAPCWANITFAGHAIAVYGEHSNWQQRYWCALLDRADYRWYNASTLAGATDPAAPFQWSLNRTRCAVSGLDPTRNHTLAVGQLAQDTQSLGITIDYYTVDQAPATTSNEDKLTWSSDFVAVDAPPGVNWAASTDGAASPSRSTSVATSSGTVSASNSKGFSSSSASSPAGTSPAAADSASASSSEDGGGTSSTAATGIGLGVGLGGLALLVLGAFLWWRSRRRRRRDEVGGGRPGSIAPTETTYAGGGGGFHSVSGGSPVSRTARARFPSTSQSYLPTTTMNHGSAPSEYGARVPEVQQDPFSSSSPTTTTAALGDSPSRFLADPATFRAR
ncbi:hypothetical protein JCM11491_004798 [Sporobolomyces phaffii]